MVHLKRTAINPLNPSGPPILVIPRVSYQDAPSDLRRYVRHDAVERHYGSARQEEADEENERLDEESDEEYGHNLSSDHDEDYEEDDECLVVDEGRGQEQVQREEFGDAEGNMGQGQGQEQPQPQQQPQERRRWVRKPKSAPGEIIVVDSSTSPEVEQEERQQQLSPTPQLRRTKAYKHLRRKVSIGEAIVADSSSSSHGQGLEMGDVQEMPKQKAKAKPRKNAPAKKVEVVEEEYDMKDTEEKPKALISKAGYIYEVPLAPKRKGGWPKGKKRGASIVKQTAFEGEEDIDEIPPTPKRKGGWPKGKKRGAPVPRQTAFEEEVEDEAAKLKGRAQAKSKPRRKVVSKAVIEDVDSQDEMVEPQQKPKLRKKVPMSKAKIESEDDESDEPQRKTTPRRKARKSDTPGTIVVDSTFEDEELVDESTKRLRYLKLPESEESEGYTTRKPKSRAGASTRGRGGGAAARGRGNLTGKKARTRVSRQTAMLKERGPSILEEEMARHGVRAKRADDELMM